MMGSYIVLVICGRNYFIILIYMHNNIVILTFQLLCESAYLIPYIILTIIHFIYMFASMYFGNQLTLSRTVDEQKFYIRATLLTFACLPIVTIGYQQLIRKIERCITRAYVKSEYKRCFTEFYQTIKEQIQLDNITVRQLFDDVADDSIVLNAIA